MIDVKITNGDIETDTTGGAKRIYGRDVLFQRAMLCMTVPKGSFVYDRELGSERGVTAAQTELLFGEALVKYSGTTVRVLGMTDEAVRVSVSIDGESRTEEVRTYGNVSGNI